MSMMLEEKNGVNCILGSNDFEGNVSVITDIFCCGDYNKNTLFQSNQFRLIVHHSQLKQSCFSIIWAQIHKFRQKVNVRRRVFFNKDY